MSDLKGIEYKRFEDIKHIREDGSEYWSARELGLALDYAKWENFAKVIKRAMMHVKTAGTVFQTIFLRSGKSLKLELPRNPKKIMNCQDMHVI